MTHTKHLRARMSQRGITSDMTALVEQFGTADGDRVVLRRKELEFLITELRRIERTALKVMDKGGVVVVEDRGRSLTTYNCKSYDGRRAKLRKTARRPNGYQWANR